MSERFPEFAQVVHQRLSEMSKHEMFVVEPTDIFASYLEAFPAGSNPMFRARTEHDCSCCKQFIRNFGRTFAIIDGKRFSVWGDGSGLPHPYDVVAARMDALIQQSPIRGVFRTKETRYGSQTSTEFRDGSTITWRHFHGVVAARHRSNRPDEDRGALDTTAHVLRRGLTEIRSSVVDDLISLVEQGTIYRGEEHLEGLKAFRRLQTAHATATDPDLMVWNNLNAPAARLRNSVIGTLLQDLSDGVDVERAVRSFETKVAPANYKRPKALITPKMVESAVATLASLGLEHAVERRFARISDVSVTDVLFVDNGVREQMKGGLKSLLMDAAKTTVTARPKNSVTPISVEEFVTKVVPTVKSMSVHLKNGHLPNFVSLTAPMHPDAGRLFKWENGFGWSYDGDVADSIKERVKRAGGNTGAALRVSLAWTNHDDLDIHARAPEGHIYYGNKLGVLDVDMNVHDLRRDAVENLSWVRPRDGSYSISVNNFNLRETRDTGFVIEVECNGVVQQFSCATNPRGRATTECISFTMKGGQMSNLRVLSKDVRGGMVPTEKWGVKTESVVRVNTLLASPNHWEGAGGVGAKHWFFILEGCKNPESTRGIYNEFLRGDLEPHRRVFEVLGAKTKCEPCEDQLSGVGFTKGRDQSVQVTTHDRTYEIEF